MTRMRSFLSLALLAAAAGCGPIEDDTPVDPGTTTQIGPAGGVVTLENGPTLRIPAGALATATTITIRATGTTSPGGAPVYSFEPVDLTFAIPATAEFPVPSGLGTSAAVYWTLQGSASEFDSLGGTVFGTLVSAPVSRLGVGHAGPPCTTDVSCSPANECHLGISSCTTGAPVCIQLDPTLEDGTACTIGICSAGACIAACNALSLAQAPVVNVAYLPATAPAATGGTIEAGTYYETAVNVYGPEGQAISSQGAWVISGTSVEGAYDAVDGTDRWSATLSTTGTTLSLGGTCGFTGTVAYDGYSATAGELRLYALFQGDVWEYVYTKQ